MAIDSHRPTASPLSTGCNPGVAGAAPPTVKILGSTVHLVDVDYATLQMQDWIEKRVAPPRQILVTGFHGLWMAHQDPALRVMLRRAELWVPDGIAPVWVARLRGHRRVCRVPGAELMSAFLALANRRGYASYFYGDTQETLNLLRSRLNSQFPGHRVAGAFSPPFRQISPAEDDQIIRQINESGADVLWIGLGLPKQERWIYEHRDRLRVPVLIGVGAAFGFLSGKVPRCPKWIGNSGFEWVFRFLMEPKKLWRRDLLDGPRFVWNVVLELFHLKKFE